jgi:hypothetical protein
MAQTNKGLPTNSTHEQSQQDTQTSTDATKAVSTHQINTTAKTGSLSLPLIIQSPSGQLSYQYVNTKNIDESFSLSQVDAGKEIISKQLHDNALNDYEEYLEDKLISISLDDADSDSAFELGDYVKITGTFSIFDTTYLKSITEPSLIRKLLQFATGADRKPSYQNHGKNNKSASNRSKPHNIRLDAETEKGIQILETVLEYLEAVLPTSMYIRQGGFVSPVKLEYLRESSTELNFKYGEGSDIKITVVGRATRRFSTYTMGALTTGLFSEVGSSITSMSDEIISSIDALKDGDIIVSPVAIYFE